jgi:hypothetical protein
MEIRLDFLFVWLYNLLPSLQVCKQSSPSVYQQNTSKRPSDFLKEIVKILDEAFRHWRSVDKLKEKIILVKIIAPELAKIFPTFYDTRRSIIEPDSEQGELSAASYISKDRITRTEQQEFKLWHIQPNGHSICTSWIHDPGARVWLPKLHHSHSVAGSYICLQSEQ